MSFFPLFINVKRKAFWAKWKEKLLGKDVEQKVLIEIIVIESVNVNYVGILNVLPMVEKNRSTPFFLAPLSFCFLY